MIWIAVAVSLAALLYWKIIKPLNYWKEQGVEQEGPTAQLKNICATILKIFPIAELSQIGYKKFPNLRYSGTIQFNIPALLLRTPDLIKQMTVKDFDHFLDHRSIIPEDADPLWAKNLVALTGERWRDMRATLSPAFTSSKMRTMFVLMMECAERLASYFVQQVDGKKEISVEMKDSFTRYANDVIASSAFGVTCNSLVQRNNEFYTMGSEATNFKGFWRNLKFSIFILFPGLAKHFNIRLFPESVTNFFTQVVKDTIHIREEKMIIRPDMIHLLMEARKGRLKYDEQGEFNNAGFSTAEESQVGKKSQSSVNQKKEITDIDITAQALIFFFAGFDTVSTLMSFMAYELAVNPEVQEKLYQEIKDVLEETGGKLTYEALLKMKYMDMVVSEALRKWPPAVATDRVCVKPYTIQPIQPNEKSVHLRKGDVLLIPIYAIHRDEKYFPQPDRFDPERFSEENKQNIEPYSYIPFGVGPRNCIGSRFALLEIKGVFFHLLSKCEITAVDKTPIPMKLCKKNFNLAAENGVWVGLKFRK